MKQERLGGMSCWTSGSRDSSDSCLVALHGWGSNALGMTPLMDEMNFSNVRAIFPNAPFAITPPARLRWYDPSGDILSDIQNSRQLLSGLLDEIIAGGVPAQRVVLLGFSQGGRLAVGTTLTYPKTLGGCVCLSGLLGSETPSEKSDVQEGLKVPFLVLHGSQDQVVPISRGGESIRDTLESLGAGVEYKEFDMGHEINGDEIDLIRKFLHGILQ